MRRVGIARTAMAVGVVFAAWQVLWVLLVGISWAGQLLSFILALHFLQTNFQLMQFSAFTALSLVTLTFCAGALSGTIFAVVWNSLAASEDVRTSQRVQLPQSISELGAGHG